MCKVWMQIRSSYLHQSLLVAFPSSKILSDSQAMNGVSRWFHVSRRKCQYESCWPSKIVFGSQTLIGTCLSTLCTLAQRVASTIRKERAAVNNEMPVTQTDSKVGAEHQINALLAHLFKTRKDISPDQKIVLKFAFDGARVANKTKKSQVIGNHSTYRCPRSIARGQVIN